MSVASNLSAVSVGFHGKEINIEMALDQIVRALQGHLNQLQCQLRQIAMSSEQTTGGDDFEDLKNSVSETDALEDEIDDMAELFRDLRDIASQLAYLPINKEEKAWLKQHKLDRKIQLAQRKKENDTRRASEKASYKASCLDDIKEN